MDASKEEDYLPNERCQHLTFEKKIINSFMINKSE